MQIIDLSGGWKYTTNEGRTGDFNLPGSACENGLGRAQEYYTEYSKEAVRAPRERYEYIGRLTLDRKIDVPASFEGKRVFVYLERVNMMSKLWMDGVQIDREHIGLSAPHVYEIAGGLSKGRHEIRLELDNSNMMHIGDMASGYSIDTQGYWIGVAGRLELQAWEPCYLGGVQVYPKSDGIDVKMTLKNTILSPWERKKARLTLQIVTPEGKKLPEVVLERTLFNSSQVERAYLPIPEEDYEYWDEFHPALYKLHISYECDGYESSRDVTFGLRFIEVRDKRFYLNGQSVAFRGTIDCAQFPLTGYPATDVDFYRNHFSKIKEYGLNLIRFHAWCPPEAAFVAADELGMYLSVEMPLWLNKDVVDVEVGSDSIHDYYFTNEAKRISKEYGNHPSFLLFSNGNENMGDFELLEDITVATKALDGRRLYAITSNFDHPVVPCEDFFCACEACGDKIRIQDIHDEVAKGSFVNYDKTLDKLTIPVMTFEVGQYCVYPDVDICEKYTGNIMPVNFDAIRKNMIAHNVYDRLSDYIKASGDLATLLYKEDIEAVLRTKGFGGYELLALADYTGQSTAMVGVLDIFYKEKGFVTGEEFRHFSGAVVPLFEAKRVYDVVSEPLIEARLALYDYGQVRIENPLYELTVYNKGEIFYQTQTYENVVQIPIDKVKTSAMLEIVLKVNDYVNRWKVFAYRNAECEIDMIEDMDGLCAIRDKAGRYVASMETIEKDPIKSGFVPVFWSPVHFPSPRPCGAMIDKDSQVLDLFPTREYPDYQWYDLLENGKGANLQRLNPELKDVQPVVEMVPNFVDNIPSSPLFIAKYGKATVLFCGFDLEREDIATRALKYSISKWRLS